MLAGPLSSLPWDDQTPQEVRSGVRTALWKESEKLAGEKNAKGKKYIRFYPSSEVDLRHGKVTTLVVIQRCLDEHLVTERVRYTFEKKGKDYEIVDREVVMKDESELLSWVDGTKHPAKAFSFEHDLLKLSFTGGQGIVSYLGRQPYSLYLTGKGRISLPAISEYERNYFRRILGVEAIDSEFEAIAIGFHPNDTQFVELTGMTNGQVVPVQSDVRFDGDLGQLVDWRNKDLRDKEYTPYVYSSVPHSIYEGYFQINVKTTAHGWITYYYSPTAVKQITVLKGHPDDPRNRRVKNAYKLISTYYSPETRALKTVMKEHRRNLRWVVPERYDAMFDIDSDKFAARVDVDLLVLHETKELEFGLSGNPRIRYVRTVDGEDLLVVPSLNLYSKKYGFEETANSFRVIFPEKLEAGKSLRLRIAYDSPKLVRKHEEGFWEVQRNGSFLPWIATLSDPVHMRFAVRTRDDYEHISIGSKIEEEVADGHRITLWGAPHTFNFPSIIVGQYQEPIVMETGGTTVRGYMTKKSATFAERSDLTSQQRVAMETFNKPMSRDALIPQVEQVKNSVALYSRIFDAAYPYDDLKVISTPAQFGWAQAPSSVIYVGDLFLISKAKVAAFMSANPNTFAGTSSHETAHQWWGGLVSNVNQFHYWFVESLAEFSSALHDHVWDPKEGYQLKIDDWRRQSLAGDWASAVVDDTTHIERIPVQALRYTKGPYVIHMLGEYFGHQKVQVFLRNLVAQYSGDLISTFDIQRVAEETFETNLQDFFDCWIYGNGIPEVRYKFDKVVQAEDGTSWVVSGTLEQVVKVQDEVVPGKTFKNLLVPITVYRKGGEPILRKVIMEGAEERFSFTVSEKPKRVVVNDKDRMLITTRQVY